eukprot:TRINITY_DN8484_c0_g1_i2.p1 TRINITY_DN8484_c0_g1~~TRINITY_DN8484_c0_g1_i2.p1  ORF type:complete len:1346 (-),score=306.49 TRINITY_DN8484_c0_g1_i2:769-4806(-)
MGSKIEEAIAMVQAKDAKERMSGVERLQQLLEHSTKPLNVGEVSSLVNACLLVLKDNNFRVSQGALQALASAAALSGGHLKIHFGSLLPAVVECLGDAKQPVRDAARRLLLALMEVSSPTIIVERAGSFAWSHSHWRVREEFARTVASAINLFAATELPFQRLLLPSVLQLLEDPNSSAREAAILCFEEMYNQGGDQFREELQRQNLRPSQLRDINARLEKIEPKSQPFDGLISHFPPSDVKAPAKLSTLSKQRNSPKAKTARQSSVMSGDNDVTEKPVDPIHVHSEKELIRELDKIVMMLSPEQDWSIRLAAMQRVEGLVFGDALDYPSFPALLKQLVVPMTSQLHDRRSSIVKQACHLLSILSKELLGDFEACAELLIPELLKLVVITVQVIAESADNCIKTMLRNCKVARILHYIVDSAKHDRSGVVRARCCDYALLVLECWVDAPEIQRAADLYEDLIKCCVGDAVSEVRSSARTCYRMFSKTWPERSRRLFASFEVGIQRLINEEEGGIHRRYASPSIRERVTQSLRNTVPSHRTQSSSSVSSGFGTSAVVAMDRSASLMSGPLLGGKGNSLAVQRRSAEVAPERSLESVLQASKQQVFAIENMLRGSDTSERTMVSTGMQASNESSLNYRRLQSSNMHVRGSVDPLARDPSIPTSVSVSAASQILPQPSNTFNAYKDSGKASVPGNLNADSAFSQAMPYSARRLPMTYERMNQHGSLEDFRDIKAPRRVLRLESQTDKSYLDAYKDPQYSSIPSFQRPLLRKHAVGRSVGSRLAIEDAQLPSAEMYNYMDGPASLNDALTEGLSVSSDWSARVAAFNYLKTSVQQGPKGVQDIIQQFDKVMKLFFQHVDDPHHKVAQAALSTLTEIIPACRKPFETFLERMLPHVFSRLVDPKEMIRQLAASALDVVVSTYSIDLVLPALLRSLDEQRSPKAKVAVIEFAISAFTKLGINGEVSSGSNQLRNWLSKLAPLANDKNAKLKETAISGIITVYNHFDSMSVLNFILSLTIEEQSALRRALKQYTPRIEVDLLAFLQSKNQRARSKNLYDQSDLVGSSSEEGYPGTTRKSQPFGRYSSGSVDSEGGRKWSSTQEPMQLSTHNTAQTGLEEHSKSFYSNDSSLIPEDNKDNRNSLEMMNDKVNKWADHMMPSNLDTHSIQGVDTAVGRLDWHCVEAHSDVDSLVEKAGQLKIQEAIQQDVNPDIMKLITQVSDGANVPFHEKKLESLQKLLQMSKDNDRFMWSKYTNQILTGVLGLFDDPDVSVREHALFVIREMLNNQKDNLVESVEVLLERLLHATKDSSAKVSSEADYCANTILSQYDPHRCLMVWKHNHCCELLEFSHMC